MATDNVKPTSNSLSLRVISRTSTTITIWWPTASDNVTPVTSIRYKVYMSSVSLWSRKTSTMKPVFDGQGVVSYTARNLKPCSQYKFLVKAIDEAGNELIYNQLTAMTAFSSSTSSSSSSNNTNPASEPAPPTPTTDKERRDQINEGLSKRIPYDNAKALTIKMPGEDALPEYMVSGNYVLHLETEKHKINSDNESIFADNLDNIYPGAIVFANNLLANGDPVLSGLDYGTVTVRVNFNTGGFSSKSNVPNDATSIQTAIHDILNQSKYQPPVRLQWKDHYVSSVNEMAASLNVSAEFLKVKADVKTSVTSKESSITHVQDYSQEYYSVVITQESDKSKYFGPEVTWAKILERMSQFENAPLAIITSVTYGRKAYKFTDFSSSSFKFDGSVSLSGGGQSVSSTANLAQTSDSKKTWLYLDGGDIDSAGSILRGDDVDKALAGLDKGTSKINYNVETSQGVPLYYTVRFLASGRTAKVSTTGSYTTVEYKPLPSMVSCTLRNNATHVAGARMKIRLDFEVACLSNGRKVPYGHKTIETLVDFGDKVTFHLLEQDPNKKLFLDSVIALQIRCRKTSNAKWYNHVEGYIYPKDGIIDLNIHGAIRPGGTNAYIHSSSYTKDITNT